MTKKNVNLKFEDLINKVGKYITNKEDLDLIEKAYHYAYDKHYGQKRLTGDDYIIHPLNVAYILAEIGADATTIEAALLHDVLEDCGDYSSEVKELFGMKVYELIEGLTKINKLNFSGENETMIANHRKILVGLSEDVRVIIIKLADRLHNMRTLWVHTEEKQKKIAKETLDILTPIAHRLGINQIKSELEDLSLRYLKPDIYFSIVETLNQTKIERDNAVIEMQNKVSELLNEHNIKHEIKGRAKSIYSIYKKLDKGRKFNDIYDLLALRIFVDTENLCYQALGIIHSKFKPIPKRFKDFIAMPKTNMYQSLHTTVFGIDGQLFEIQIRTYEMDKVAERGIASHWSYKEGGKSSMQDDMEQKLQFFRSIIELKNEEETEEQFVTSVKEEVLKNTIYVFTPKGDVVELPNKSTPIDFAYRVHSEVGNKMVGAIVNNNIVPLDYELHDNDIIKINTNKNSIGPSREWINMAKTTQAKNKIKNFFNKVDKEGYLKEGQEALHKELRKRKIPISEFFTNDNINKILKELKYNSIDDVYIKIGSNSLPVNQVINIINNTNDTKEEIILKKVQNPNIKVNNTKNDVEIVGIDDIKTNMASCCKPVPGDRIVGYITKGYGITIHRMVCPNVADLEDRIIEAKWTYNGVKKYPTAILVKAIKDKNLLMDIVAKTSSDDIQIQSIKAINGTDNTYEVVVLVENKEKLVKFMNSLENIKSVVSVEREIL